MKIAPTFTARTVLSNFGPWIVYGVLSAAGYERWSYLGGLAASLYQTAPQWRGWHLKIMDGVSLLFFIAGAVSTLLFHSALFVRNGSFLIWAALAVVALGSLLIGSPFTAEYAREAVSRSFWNNPGFRRVNVRITAVWGAVFAGNAACAATIILEPAGALGQMKIWLQAAPYIGTIIGIVFTNRFPQWASRRSQKDDLPEPDLKP